MWCSRASVITSPSVRNLGLCEILIIAGRDCWLPQGFSTERTLVCWALGSRRGHWEWTALSGPFSSTWYRVSVIPHPLVACGVGSLIGMWIKRKLLSPAGHFLPVSWHCSAGKGGTKAEFIHGQELQSPNIKDIDQNQLCPKFSNIS